MTNPAQRVDPLASLFTPSRSNPAIPLRYRSGKLTAWDITTGESTVEIDGVAFENLPVVPGSYLGVLADNDVVTLLSTTDESGLTTYLIAGMAITPPDVRLARASARPGYVKYGRALGELSGNTTSASFVELANTSIASFFKTAADTLVEIEMTGTCYASGATAGARIGCLIDGATDVTVANLAEANSLLNAHTPYAGSVRVSLSSAGSHTFQPRWLRISGTGTLHVDSGDLLSMTIREVS